MIDASNLFLVFILCQPPTLIERNNAAHPQPVSIVTLQLQSNVTNIKIYVIYPYEFLLHHL
jgi:hypothetical protein